MDSRDCLVRSNVQTKKEKAFTCNTDWIRFFIRTIWKEYITEFKLQVWGFLFSRWTNDQAKQSHYLRLVSKYSKIKQNEVEISKGTDN